MRRTMTRTRRGATVSSTRSGWMKPAGAIRQSQTGAIVLPPPTWTTLRELEPVRSVDAALAWARRREVVRRQPELLEEQGRRMLVIPGDPLHPDPPPRDAPVETRFVFAGDRWRPERART